jgi:hypothetical protein
MGPSKRAWPGLSLDSSVPPILRPHFTIDSSDSTHRIAQPKIGRTTLLPRTSYHTHEGHDARGSWCSGRYDGKDSRFSSWQQMHASINRVFGTRKVPGFDESPLTLTVSGTVFDYASPGAQYWECSSIATSIAAACSSFVGIEGEVLVEGSCVFEFSLLTSKSTRVIRRDGTVLLVITAIYPECALRPPHLGWGHFEADPLCSLQGVGGLGLGQQSRAWGGGAWGLSVAPRSYPQNCWFNSKYSFFTSKLIQK